MSKRKPSRDLKSQAQSLRNEGKADEAQILESLAHKVDRAERTSDKLKSMQEAVNKMEKKTPALSWQLGDLVGNELIGFHDGERLFEIKRGTLVYTLYILDEDVKKRNRITFSTSTQLNRMKNKADKICQEHYIPYLKN